MIEKSKNHKLTFLLLLPFATLLACSIQKTNDKTEVPVEVPIDVPKIIDTHVKIESPKSILYLNTSVQKQFSEIPMAMKTMSFVNSLDGGLFVAKGNGGLGVESLFDDNNLLAPYSGIPVTITGRGEDGEAPSVSIFVSGDKSCARLFNFDSVKSRIAIDDSQLNTLTACHIKVEATLSKNEKVVKDTQELDVTLNPTLLTYSTYQDPTYQYLVKYSGLSDNVALIAKWITDLLPQANGLKLKYLSSLDKYNVNIHNVNALTGAQSVTKLDLSGTDIRDLSALVHLENLQELNLSNCKKFEAKDLAILGQLKSLKSLNISNTDIKDLKVITDNIKSLEELDISKNTHINDLENIENLPNLRRLKASGIGLRSLDKLSDIVQVVELDISHNDFSSHTKADAQKLVNLYNLESLDISKSHVPDEFLNEFFGGVYRRGILKKFVDANGFYVQGEEVTEEECKRNINNFHNITNLSLMTSLEHIDIHGNRCDLVNDITTVGMYDTYRFMGMRNLTYLDITHNPVFTLDGLAGLKNLKTLHVANHPYIDEKGVGKIKFAPIKMTPETCIGDLGGSISNPLAYECSFLTSKNVSVDFKEATTHTFTVPNGVYTLTLEACSSGDGGYGETGKRGTNSFAWQYTTEHIYTDKGGTTRRYRSHKKEIPAADPESGKPGEQGTLVTMTDILSGQSIFQSTDESFYKFPIEDVNVCRGGAGGGNAQAGNNKKLVHSVINVKPTQKFSIFIPAGGQGGEGGMGGQYTNIAGGPAGYCKDNQDPKNDPDFCNGINGANGQNGSQGSNGYLKISYRVPATEA